MGFPQQSPQANIPDRRSVYQLTEAISRAPGYNVNGPTIVSAAGRVALAQPFRGILILQNLSTTALYYTIGTAATGQTITPSAASCHGVLSACAVQDDGTGGSVDLSMFRDEVWVSASSVRVAVLEGLTSEGA